MNNSNFRFQISDVRCHCESRVIGSWQSQKTRFFTAFRMTVLIAIFNFTFLIFNCLYADVSGAKFLEIQSSVRAAALGDASSSICGESSLMFSNPANTSFANQRGEGENGINVSVSYNKYIQDINQGLVSGLFLFQGSACGVGYSSLKMKDEPLYDEFGLDSGKKFNYGGNVISGNISTFLTEGFSAGANVKSVKEDIGDYSANTIGFDLGLGAKIDFLHFGLAYLNIGKIDNYKLPATLRVGMSAGGVNKGLTVCSDYVSQTVEKKSEIGIGLEYIISEVIAPRIGYKVSLSKGISGISGGVGLKLKNLSLDYAFVPYQDFGDTHNVELSVAFGSGRATKVAPTGRDELVRPSVEKPITKPLIERTTVAIMNLAAGEGMSASDAAMISELLRTAIINTNSFIIIERGQIEQVMAEAGFQQTGCTDQSCAVKIGNMVNAKKVIVGSVGKLATDYIVNIRLVDVETSKVEYADKGKTGVLSDMESTVDELAKRITNLVK